MTENGTLGQPFYNRGDPHRACNYRLSPLESAVYEDSTHQKNAIKTGRICQKNGYKTAKNIKA